MAASGVSTAAGDTAATLVHVDPASLIVGVNARLTARLTESFVSSVRERGVRQAIVAYRDDGGALVVLHGQRRTLAAVRANRRSVPVMVVARPEERDRLFDQVTENDHRECLTVAERVAAYGQLALCGVSAAQIAKGMATGRAVVDKALAVAGSKLARAAAGRWEFLTLDQAAVVAEFESDPQAVRQLVVAAQRGGFDHVAQRLRDARVEAAARDAAAAALAAAGITVVERPSQDGTGVKRLADLTHGGQRLSADSHASCPGHAAYLRNGWVEPAEPNGADVPATGGTGAGDDGQGRTERSASYRAWVPEYVCTDFAAHGHVPSWSDPLPGGRRQSAAGVSEEQREQVRARRREVIRANKDWDSAETVRHRWLRTFLSRRSAPGSAAGFIAGSLARADHAVTQALTGGNRLADDLFGLPERAPVLGRRAPALVDLVGKASHARAQMIALGLVLAGYEQATSRDAWRRVSDNTARYLRYLEANGYELSAVELRACGEVPLPDPATGCRAD